MELQISPQGTWAQQITGLQLEDATAMDARSIGELCINKNLVLLRNQNLSLSQQARFCEFIGSIPRDKDKEKNRAKDIVLEHGVVRVTGEKNDDGKEGLFGHESALDWHANKASSQDRAPLVWLYAHKGSAGSQTSWINTALAYQDLPHDLKEELSEVTIHCGFQKGRYTQSDYFKEHINTKNPFPLIYTNIRGRKGLYFPFLQTFDSPNLSSQRWKEVSDFIIQHMLHEKYVYHHYWQDGDVIISDQWHTLHKRWSCENMQQRVLHRIAFNYEHLIENT